MASESQWKHHGVRVVHANELDINTPQTPGMNRAAAITRARRRGEALGRNGGDPSQGQDRRPPLNPAERCFIITYVIT